MGKSCHGQISYLPYDFIRDFHKSLKMKWLTMKSFDSFSSGPLWLLLLCRTNYPWPAGPLSLSLTLPDHVTLFDSAMAD